jgi:thioesterase domain-containing protein
VAVDHGPLDSYLTWAGQTYAARSALLHSSFSFDFTVTTLFVPLLCGGCVEIVRDTADGLLRRLARGDSIDLLKLTPTHLQAMGELLDAHNVLQGPSCLVVGGEALFGEQLTEWRRRYPNTKLVNEYGPTETVVGCCIDVKRLGDVKSGRIPIGGPVWNTQLYVLDAAGSPVPVGIPGELYIGGAQVVRGCVGRPALTADRFRPDPFGTAGGARLYRTGDLVRRRATGDLEYLRRVDDQVKVRGFRIELGEVAAALRQQPGVADCAVVLGESPTHQPAIVAYVTGSASVDCLREQLSGILPDHMMPSAIVVMDRLPVTTNGKLDRTALPRPDDARQGSTEPRNYVELQLIQIWEGLLGTEVNDPTRGFFELGGHSLLAMRLLAEIRRRFRCDRPVSSLFTRGSVREMAEAIQNGLPAEPPSAVVSLQAKGSSMPLFLVHTANGRFLCYVNLVRHLGGERPIWGFQDLSGNMSRPVPHIAAEYVDAIRSVQPDGPYALAGWSFGGLVAYEMASLLEQQGQRVAFVGLLDTNHPSLSQGFVSDDLDLLVDSGHEIAIHSGRRISITRAELEGLDHDEQFTRVASALHAVGVRFDASWLRQYVGNAQQRGAAARAYEPGPFAGGLTLFRASGNRWNRFLGPITDEERRTLGWSRVSAVVDVHPVPGSHDTMVREPAVRELAQRMRDVLADADTGTPLGHAVGSRTPTVPAGVHT